MSYRMRKQLSAEELASFQEDFVKGMYSRELCQKYGLSEGAVSRLLKRYTSLSPEVIKQSHADARELKKLKKKLAEQEKIIEAFRDLFSGKMLGRKI
jgi:hypothetical protein